MNLIPPLESAALAAASYTVLETSNIKEIIGVPELAKIKREVDISNVRILRGRTGGLYLSNSTNFCLALEGKDGRFKNDLVLAIRGSKVREDYYTDAMCSFSSLPSGRSVHKGFHLAYNSLMGEIEKYLRQSRKHYQQIHIIGHSLGGALANLVAHWVATHSVAQPRLYTFGAPRVGSQSFAMELHGLVKSRNMFRLYHRQDIISHVPLWPFYHSPYPGDDCPLDLPNTNAFGFLSAQYHSIGRYLQTLRNDPTWSSLKIQNPRHASEYQAQRLMSEMLEGRLFPPGGMSTQTLEKMATMIRYFLRKCAQLVPAGVQATLAYGFTGFDWLAYSLHQLAQQAKDLKDQVQGFVRSLAGLVNMRLSASAQIGLGLMKQIFHAFKQLLKRMIRAALNWLD